MFPLKQRIIIPGRDFNGHIKAGLGGGVDYRASYVPFWVTHSGIGKKVNGPQGGLQYHLTRPNGDRIELFHLKSISIPNGPALAGMIGGVTGNSGRLKPGAPPYAPHLHLQIFNKAGVRLDPEKYDWGDSLLNEDTMLRTYKKTIYALVAGYWIAVSTSYDDFVKNFGGQNAPEMTKAQFDAFPTHKNVIK